MAQHNMVRCSASDGVEVCQFEYIEAIEDGLVLGRTIRCVVHQPDPTGVEVRRCDACGIDVDNEPHVTGCPRSMWTSIEDAVPTCDHCGEQWEDGGEGEDWNGDTGCHYSCEAEQRTASVTKGDDSETDPRPWDLLDHYDDARWAEMMWEQREYTA